MALENLVHKRRGQSECSRLGMVTWVGGEVSVLADMFWKKAVTIGHLSFSVLAITQK